MQDLPSRIVFVDDEQHVLDSLERTLRDRRHIWTMKFANSPRAALELLAQGGIQLVVSDVRMPGMDGLDLLAQIKGNPQTSDVAVVMLTGQEDRALKCRALDLGATDLLNKPIETADLVARIRNVLQLQHCQAELKQQNLVLESKVQERTAALAQSRLEIIWRLAKAAEYRDEDTGHHVLRVGCYSRVIAERLGLDRAFVETIFLTAPLHDIGKIGIPDAILLKPGKLTDEEWLVMKQHCAIGARILREQSKGMTLFQQWKGIEKPAPQIVDPLMDMACTIALSHHEKWDGSGYPHALAGEQIPLPGRIVALADVFDALVSQRPYKPAFPEEKALQILRDGAGKHFDPEVLLAFEASLDQIRAIRDDLSDHPHAQRVPDEECVVC